MRQLRAKKTDEGTRLDKFLLKYMNTAPSSFIHKMLRKKNIKLNGKKAEGSILLKEGDVIDIYISDASLENFMSKRQIKPVDIKPDIVYEDENIILCNKPVGILSQGNGSEDVNINDALLYYLYKKGEYDISEESVFKPGICNRLDRNTGGIIAMGKNAAASAALNKAFSQRGVSKLYIGVLKGELSKKGSIEGWIGKNEENKVTFYSEKTENALYSKTLYRPLCIKEGYTLVELELFSGRTHQIRVAMEHLGYPVIGDRKYGGRKDLFGAGHQILYAYKLVFGDNKGVLSYLNGREFVIKKDSILEKVSEFFRKGGNDIEKS